MPLLRKRQAVEKCRSMVLKAASIGWLVRNLGFEGLPCFFSPRATKGVKVTICQRLDGEEPEAPRACPCLGSDKLYPEAYCREREIVVNVEGGWRRVRVRDLS